MPSLSYVIAAVDGELLEEGTDICFQMSILVFP